MPRAHGQLLHALRGEDLAAVFVRRTDVDQLHVVALLGGGQHVRQVGPQPRVGGLDRHAAGRRRARPGAEGAPLGLPLDAPAVEQLDVGHPVHIEYPGTPGGEPVVVVAVENGGGVVGDAGLAQQRLEVLLAGDVAADRVDQVAVPGEVHRAGNVPALVEARHHADLDDAHLGIVEVLFQPVGADQIFAGGLDRQRDEKGGDGQQAGAEQCFDVHGAETPVRGI
ncbi:hypothetical protein D9M68_456950 [compost metagenome]